MKRKKTFFRAAGAVALLAFGWVFVGCQQPGGGDNPPPSGPSYGNLQEIKDLIDSTPGDEVTVKLSSAITTEDVAGVWPDPDPDAPEGATLEDGLGSLYQVLGTSKKIHLDLSEVDWKVEADDGTMVRGIPGASNPIIYEQYRVGNPIASIIFPRDIVIIEPYAFANAQKLKKIDLKGQSRLTYLGEGAFRNDTAVTEIDFSGCSALKRLGPRSLQSLTSLEMLDFSPTSLEIADGYAFRHNYSLKYIEFPATLQKLDDYACDVLYSLEYARFRNVNPHHYLHGWSSFLYSDNAEGAAYNGLPVDVWKYGSDAWESGTLKTYKFFHPNTIQWSTGPQFDYWSQWGSRNFLQARHAPLPYSGNPGKVYPDDVDKLRGQALLDYYSKVKEVKVEATGLNAYEGKEVVSNINGVKGTISGGKLSLTIGVPTSGLKVLDETTGQEITGLYDSRSFYNSPKGVADEWTADGLGNGHQSKDGLPQIGPKGKVKFAILELTVDGSEFLTRASTGAYTTSVNDDGVTNVLEDLRVMRYVYVDQAVSIVRASRDNGMKKVYLDLEEGWNQIEATRTLQYPAGATSASASVYMVNVWLSGGINVDGDLANPPRQTQTPGTKELNEKEIPWVVTPQDLYRDVLLTPFVILPWN